MKQEVNSSWICSAFNHKGVDWPVFNHKGVDWPVFRNTKLLRTASKIPGITLRKMSFQFNKFIQKILKLVRKSNYWNKNFPIFNLAHSFLSVFNLRFHTLGEYPLCFLSSWFTHNLEYVEISHYIQIFSALLNVGYKLQIIMKFFLRYFWNFSVYTKIVLENLSFWDWTESSIHEFFSTKQGLISF